MNACVLGTRPEQLERMAALVCESIPGSAMSTDILIWSVRVYPAAEQTSNEHWRQVLELLPNNCRQSFAETCLTMHLNDDCKGTAVAEMEQQLKQSVQQARSKMSGLTIEHRCCVCCSC